MSDPVHTGLPTGGGTLHSPNPPTPQERDTPMERRLHTRHRAKTTVYVTVPGRGSRVCKANNLSANGVFVETPDLKLIKGAAVELAFAINLGAVTKIHRRNAIVAHSSQSGTGLRMESFASQQA